MTDLCVQVLSITKQLDAGREDLRMAHTEEGTEGNLHSGHTVYTTALVEVWAGGMDRGPPARDTHIWFRQDGEGLGGDGHTSTQRDIWPVQAGEADL